jgi:hypothetical protein
MGSVTDEDIRSSASFPVATMTEACQWQQTVSERPIISGSSIWRRDTQDSGAFRTVSVGPVDPKSFGYLAFSFKVTSKPSLPERIARFRSLDNHALRVFSSFERHCDQ